MEDLILDIHRETSKFKFWDEINKSTILHLIECGFKPEVLKYWGVSDIIINGDKYLTK